jgi:hypothetical protein
MNTLPLDIIKFIGDFLDIKTRIRIFFKVINLIDTLKYTFNESENIELLNYYIKKDDYFKILTLKKIILIESLLCYCVVNISNPQTMHLFLSNSNFESNIFKHQYIKTLKFCLLKNNIIKTKIVFGYFEHDNYFLNTFLKLFISKYFKKINNACLKYVLQQISFHTYQSIKKYCLKSLKQCDIEYMLKIFEI